MKTSKLTGAALDWAVAKCDCPQGVSSDNYWEESYKPSTNWAQGGPIIERENIALRRWLECGWQADKWNFKFVTGISQGNTPLIAAMRCYVTSKLGDEIDIPKELL